MRKTIYQHVIAGYTIRLDQFKPDHFSVTYGQQEKALLGYEDAAKELGACIMHALACESMLDNGLDAAAKDEVEVTPSMMEGTVQ